MAKGNNYFTLWQKNIGSDLNKVEIEVSGQPQGKGRPRFTRSGRAYTPAKTKAYENRVKAATWAVMKQQSRVPTQKPVYVEVIAFMEIPKSWSKKKKIAAEFGAIRHEVKPDIDNIIKSALDGISGPQGVIFDDKQVHTIKAQKQYCHPARGPVLYISVSWE